MPRSAATPDPGPDWLGLVDATRSRAGFFTASEALDHHISSQLLRYRVSSGWAHRELRGVYRIAGAPPTDHDELIALSLWSSDEGVFSHVTALALHELSDALPAKIHMSVPTSWTWKYGRFARSRNLVLHVEDLSDEDVEWRGHIRVTKVARTLADCITAKISPSLITQALTQAAQRKLITRAERTRLQRDSLKATR